MNNQTLPQDVAAVKAIDRAHILHPWTIQRTRDPLVVTNGRGCFFWGPDGRKYLDFYSQAVNVNAGHQHPKVIAAIKEQLDSICFVESSFANVAAVRLADLLTKCAPRDLTKVFFTTGGGEAIEHAIRMARAFTGKEKIVARYRSYHGGAYGAIAASGDPRRPPAESGPSAIVRVFSPFRYRCAFCKNLAGCSMECAEHVRETIIYENPDTVAAVLLEAVTGSSGVVIPPEGYLSRIREICDEFGILLIADEVYTGFGRTGKWFSIEHWGVVPDLMVLGKGITSGAVPLGAVMISSRIARFFEDRMLWSGLTNFGHPIACAAGIGALKAYSEDRLVENASTLGQVLKAKLEQLATQYEAVAEVRSIGLLACLELVTDRETREPLVAWGQTTSSKVMDEFAKFCFERGVYVRTRWGLVFVAPPLCITKDELDSGLAVIDEGLMRLQKSLANSAPHSRRTQPNVPNLTRS